METIKVISIHEDEIEYTMNFAMLLAEVRRRRSVGQGNKILIKVGAYKCMFEVLEENFVDEGND